MFIKKILPSTGVYCISTPYSAGGFKNIFFNNLDVAIAKLSVLDRTGFTCYIAQATFDNDKIVDARNHNKSLPKTLTKAEYIKQKKGVRTQSNALKLKNFFLDIDVGEKWPLKSQLEAAIELKKFIKETGLPFPAVVNSGNGLYTHWILSEEITASQWTVVAKILKSVVATYSPALGADSSRTSDSASILRLPGTTNRKPGKVDKPVSLIKDMEPVDFLSFVKKLSAAAKKRKIDISQVKAPKSSKDINSEFYCAPDDIPKSAHKIADKCVQFSAIRELTGNISEPLWYACLGILAHCDNGDTIAQEWSKGHPEYDPDQTELKLSQWRNANVGPTTCANFGSLNPNKCVGCKYNGQIKSPIVLGLPEPEKKEIEDTQCSPPNKFVRSKKGLQFDMDGRWVLFYDQDLYVDSLAFDESLGYEVMKIKHHLPYEGNLEFTIRSSTVNDVKFLINTLADNHVKVVGALEKKLMAAYLEGYAAKLQRKRRMALLLCQMGWKKSRNGQPIFVLGKKIFHKDGSVEDASLAKNVPRAAGAYRTAGSLENWSMATQVLDKPGMEPFAFALLAGGFGAPLMKFTGFDGAMVSLVGTTGAGKTLLLRWIQSVWGYHHDLMMLKDDTKNALVSRLGVYGNLPLTVDEVTNLSGMELSDIVYRVTQGRDKARLTKNSEEKAFMNSWNTLAVVSTNSSIVDKLAGAKHDAAAEINRVFEYQINTNKDFQGNKTTAIYWILNRNYGHAGEIYAKWLVQNTDKIEESIVNIKNIIDKHARMQGEERFWGAILAAAITGGVIAKQLGLIRFDIHRVMNWATATIISMRGNKKELIGDSIDALGQFIDDHAGSRLLVKGSGRGAGKCTIIEEPRGALIMRYELDNLKLYISRQTFKIWIGKRYGNFTQIKNDLIASEILTNQNSRKVLGGGTTYGGAQQACWEIDISNPRLGGSVGDLIDLTNAYMKNEECEVKNVK